jgi:hypothetical protein
VLDKGAADAARPTALAWGDVERDMREQNIVLAQSH